MFVAYSMIMVGLAGLAVTIPTQAVPLWRFKPIRRDSEPVIWWFAVTCYACMAFAGVVYGLVILLTR